MRGAAITAAAAAAIALGACSGSSDPIVPDVSGFEEGRAKAILKDAGFTVRASGGGPVIDLSEAATAPNFGFDFSGRSCSVANQIPQGGAEAPIGSRVEIALSCE